MVFVWLYNLFTPALPMWAHGLECEICGKSFGSAQAHYEYVSRSYTENNHDGKIPRLLK